MAAMCIRKTGDNDIQVESDAYYERQGQEEIYLEEVEEELRMILECDDSSPSKMRIIIKHESKTV